MIPLVGNVNELQLQADVLANVAQTVAKETGVNILYLIGTMIEIPRAALTADDIAHIAKFFSFGTNDLTQTTFGLSRDDSNKFMPFYLEKDIYPRDPFQAIDRDGVGKLMRMAVEVGRGVNPELKIGICGEHGGEPSSVEFCHNLGMNYVSLFTVPRANRAACRGARGAGESQKTAPAKKSTSGTKKRAARKRNSEFPLIFHGMRIALDLIPAQHSVDSGYGRYIYQLSSRLVTADTPHEFLAILGTNGNESLLPHAPNLSIARCNSRNQNINQQWYAARAASQWGAISPAQYGRTGVVTCGIKN